LEWRLGIDHYVPTIGVVNRDQVAPARTSVEKRELSQQTFVFDKRQDDADGLPGLLFFHDPVTGIGCDGAPYIAGDVGELTLRTRPSAV